MFFEPFGQLPVSDIGPGQLGLEKPLCPFFPKGGFVAIGILSHLDNIYHKRYFPVDKLPIKLNQSAVKMGECMQCGLRSAVSAASTH